MKKICLMLLGVTMLVACGRNKNEQMLYDYQQKNVSSLNFDLEDLDFKIQEVEKLADITGLDSMKHLKFELAEFWVKNPEQSLIDTLSFQHVKNVLNESIILQDTLQNLYQEAVLSAIKRDDYSYEMESKRNRDKAIDQKLLYRKSLSTIEKIESRYNELSKNPEIILSTKYKASYSLRNPMLGNAKQSFNKIYYTNIDHTEFIKEETLEGKEN
ncbi:hypothetical protein ACFSKL_04275 [Belliella marina]|uniref:Lipoprotein n=1 Tax=Belliella marina TaxID=1644146 RepID=A0ABW4VH29_9BACT